MWSDWEIHRSEQEFMASRKKEILILNQAKAIVWNNGVTFFRQ